MARGKMILTSQLVKDYDWLNSILFDNLLPNSKEISLGFNTGMTRCLGKYQWKHGDVNFHKISLSYNYYFSHVSLKCDGIVYCNYYITLIHEMVHMYLRVIGRDCVSHSREFYVKLDECLNLFSTHLSDKHNGESVKIYIDESTKHLNRYKTYRVAEEYMYVFECPECSAMFKYKRMSKWAKVMLSGKPIPHKCVGGVINRVCLNRK